MRSTGWMILAYALLVFLGGIFGYVKAGSTPSLIMGVIFSVILSTSAFALFNAKKIGFFVATIATSTLAIFFFYRFVTTFKFMPSGLMCLISLVVLAILFFRRP